MNISNVNRKYDYTIMCLYSYICLHLHVNTLNDIFLVTELIFENISIYFRMNKMFSVLIKSLIGEI